jgi:hypothetical protein
MDLGEFSNWLSSTGFSQAIQLSWWAIPSIQTVHILALSLLAASALLFALRFSGRGLAAEPLHQLVPRLARLIWILLVVLAVSGLLLIVAEPYRTIANAVFYLKMAMLLVVILLTLWLAAVSKHELERISAIHRAGAALTVLLWIGIMFAGRFIAYYESF